MLLTDRLKVLVERNTVNSTLASVVCMFTKLRQRSACHNTQNARPEFAPSGVK